MNAPAQGRNNLRGMLLLAAAVLMFSCLDVQAKWLSQQMPVLQVAWARYFGHFAIMAVFLWPRYGRRLLATRRPVLQLLRSLLLLACTVLFFTAISFMPLADAVAIGFVSPLLITALSMPMLKEAVGPRRWTAVAVGFIGALVILRPGLGAFDPAGLLVLLMAFFYALYQITTRILSPTEQPLTTLFYSALIGALALTAALPAVWQPPETLLPALMMAGLGCFGGFGHFLLIRAYDEAPAALVAPLSYTSLLWGTLFGWFLFGDFPDAWTLTGAAILIATGCYILYREGLRRTPAVPASGSVPPGAGRAAEDAP